MCGIFAYLAKDGEVTVNLKQQFMKGQSRGPESTEFLIINNLHLGFHRLAINGLNPKSNQPIIDNGIYLICNGEIYNYRTLECNLKTNSDCEVIIHLYQMYGIDYLFDLLDGVFAFVLYDSNVGKVYIARDPYGVRPMYYFQDDCGIAFASEIKQLTDLTNESIKHVKPGSYLEINSKGEVFKKVKFSTFGFSKFLGKSIYKTVYYSLLDAVKKRVVGTTERPIACLLSGGLDSSLITALVNSFLPPGKLETYSIGLLGSTDLVYAEKVAKYLGTKHTSIILTEQEFFDAIPEVIYAIESYDTTTVRASVGNYLIGKYIKANSEAKVIFNGDGSDELTGGYLYFNKAPDPTEFDRECKRLLNNIHYFDVLRSDRCISTHGLEPRTPFLDRSFVQTYLSIPSEIRCHSVHGKPEKYLLRDSVKYMNSGLLPNEVLYRTKEAFSDGVSSMDRSWYTIIQEKVKNLEEVNQSYLWNNPTTPEQQYYRTIFEKHFPGRGELVPYFWMPRYTNATDPSARTLK